MVCQKFSNDGNLMSYSTLLDDHDGRVDERRISASQPDVVPDDAGEESDASGARSRHDPPHILPVITVASFFVCGIWLSFIFGAAISEYARAVR